MELSTVSRSTPKLRSSCDACGQAKTKCDRSRPQCGRCLALNLSCVYGPSRQFGKRPRRRLRPVRHVAPSTENASALDRAKADHLNGLLPQVEETLPELVTSLPEDIHIDTAQFDPTFIASLPNSWLGLNDVAKSNDTTLLGFAEGDTLIDPTSPAEYEWDRMYQEPNEILQSLTVHRTAFNPDKVLIEMSRILEANKTALQCVSRFLKLDHAKRMPHLIMLYANIVARVLIWYQDTAGFGDVFRSRNQDPLPAHCFSRNDPSPTTPGVVPGWTPKCFAIYAQSVAFGNFSVDDPSIQGVFRNQLLCHEVNKAGAVIDDLSALAANEKVAEGDRVMYTALGVWLKGEHEKTMKVFKDAIRRATEEVGI